MTDGYESSDVLVAFTLKTIANDSALNPRDRVLRDLYWIFQVGNSVARHVLEPLVVRALVSGCKMPRWKTLSERIEERMARKPGAAVFLTREFTHLRRRGPGATRWRRPAFDRNGFPFCVADRRAPLK